jgi:hypothetical protein
MINRYSKYKNKKFQYAVAVYIYKICLQLEIDDFSKCALNQREILKNSDLQKINGSFFFIQKYLFIFHKT